MGLNLILPANELTAFIGPSGCGKSTLLRSLNRMNDLVEGCKITGDIRLDNEDIYGSMDINLLRKRVGMVFQKANPFPMSIYDNVAYGPRLHGVHSKKELDAIVEQALRGAMSVELPTHGEKLLLFFPVDISELPVTRNALYQTFQTNKAAAKQQKGPPYSGPFYTEKAERLPGACLGAVRC